VWALETEGPDHSVKANTLIIAPEDTLPNLAKPTAFCEDASQEILVLDWTGRLFSLAPRTR
jgi:hypothetical protein